MGWLIILLGGVLGSSHCIGMCGGFALALGTRPGLAANLRRQIAYSLGRVFTYSCAGTMAGFAGWRLAAELDPVVRVQALLCIAAGLLLLVQGTIAAGLWRGFRLASDRGPCLGPGMFAALLGATRLRSVFLGGVVNGLLPCGLVYAYLALAASAGDLFRGGATMALFGLGTVPTMVMVGCGGSLLSVACRRYLVRVAAWCVVLTGLISIIRGLGFLDGFGAPVDGGCPLCQ
jgi:sulfite exporter TauE/SafE